MKLVGTDPEEVLLNSFLQFDEKRTGYIAEELFRECLATMGDRFSDEEITELLVDMSVKNDMINYVEFCQVLKNGKKEQV